MMVPGWAPGQVGPGTRAGWDPDPGQWDPGWVGPGPVGPGPVG